MKKTRFLTVCLLFSYITGFAQVKPASEYFTGISSLIAWIENIDDILIRIPEKEKLKRIYRGLGVVSEDFDNIALKKELLAIELGRLATPVKPEAKLKIDKLAGEILSDLNKLTTDLSYIKRDIHRTDQPEVQTIVTLMSKLLAKKGEQITIVKGLLFGSNPSTTDIKGEAEKSIKLANKMNILVMSAKTKIRAKLTS